jgi:hypothetical protein
LIANFFSWLVNMFRRNRTPAPLTVPRSFFGHMIQGELLSTPEKITIPIGTLRIWNNGASLEWVYKNNWQGFDVAVAYGTSIGADILYVLAGEPTSGLPELPIWRNFVGYAVQQAAGRIKIWETWNEAVYCKGAGARDILAYALVAYKIIKAADPNAIVLTPSFNELQTAYGAAFADDYLAAMVAGGGYGADAIAFHSYGDPIADFKAAQSLMARHSIDLPIYLTEGIATPEILAELARLGLKCFIHNAQIAGADDYDASTGRGLAWQNTFNQLTGSGP